MTQRVSAIGDVKKYWDARPCNVRHSAQPVGTAAYFTEVEQRKYFVEPHIPGFADFARWKSKRVLEIGCGIGTDAVNFARAGADYTGIELSPISLQIARQRFDFFGLPGRLIEGNAEELDGLVIPDSYDMVYSFGVIHHTPNPRAVVECARRAIRANGELKIMLYARHSWKAIMISAGLDQPEAQAGCPIAHTYSEDEVRDLLRGCFAVTEVRQEHIFPYKVEKYVQYEYEKQPWFAAMPEEMFSALQRHLGWHLLITAKPEFRP
jgi:SAM-dependent methyltransferase